MSTQTIGQWNERLKDRTPIPALDFDPPDYIAEQLLSDLAEGESSLSILAQKAHTTVEAITLWLTRPDIDARLNAMESIFARRARLQVANYTGGILTACCGVIDNYNNAESRMLFRPGDLKGHVVLARLGSNALLASRIMLHLARHYSGASPKTRGQPSPTTPAPSSGPAPAQTPTPSDSDSPHTTRFNLLPPLQDLTLNLHDQRESNHTTPNNPAHNNAATAPAATLGGRGPLGPTEHLPTSAPPTPASQAEGLTGNSRGLSESASATPGPQRNESPHPERVQLSTAPDKPPCAGRPKSRTTKPCTNCAPGAPTPTTLLTIAGTTTTRTKRPRESPKPTA